MPQLMQIHAKATGSALVQLRASGQSPAQMKVASYLRQQGSKINSRILSAIAERVEMDPFKKVKKMIKDLIVKLMQQANDEADHKGWCDMELATNEKTRNEKSESVLALTAEIDELEASVASLAEEIAGLTQQVAELDAAMAKATALRTEEKTKNTVTIKEAMEGQEAVSNAIGVLKDFYEGASTATAFTQTRAKAKAAQPEVFS